MGTTSAPTGSAGQLQLTLTEVGYNAAGNYSTVNVVASIYTPPGTYDSDPISLSLSGGVNWSTGSWSFDSSGGWHTIYNGNVNIGHNADGTGSVGVTFALNTNTGTSGVGGPASVYNAIGLTTLTVPPGTPTGLAAARSSDSLINLSWTRSYASNGVPTGTTIQQSVNGGAFGTVASSGNIASASVSAAANQKLVYQVDQSNGAGSSAWSAASAPVWTTPAAPTGCTAAKQGTGSILVSWTNNVAYAEYATEVWHGTVSGGTTTWDASPLTTAASGATSYTHASPDPASVHVYQVRAVTTSGTVLQSSYATSNSVQLLTAPNAPTVATLPQFTNKAAALAINWTHNAIDSTAQTAYELQRSTDGGNTWTTTGKTTSTVSSFTIAASTYAANVSVQLQVRTWGQASTGGSDGTGASPWSTVQSVTFKTAPTLAITQPTSGTGLAQAHATVNLSFAQAEGATAVQSTITLLQGATVLETVNTTTLTGIPLATRLSDGSTYTIQAVVTDSNGLTGTAPSQTFAVTYAEPVSATLACSYDSPSGMSQLALTFPAPVSTLLSNGSFETAGAPVTIATNLCTNPNAVGSSGFSSNNGTVHTRTLNVAITGGPQGITTAASSVINSGQTSPAILSMYNVDSLSNTGPARYHGAWVYVTGSGYVAYWVQDSAKTPIPNRVWTWLPSVNALAANSFSQLTIAKSDNSTPPTTDIAYVTGVTCDANAAPSEAIWGGRPASGDFTYAWTGTANASTSVQQALSLPSVGSNQAAVFQSSDWASAGSKSLRITPNTTTTDSFAYIAPNGGWVSGRTYTMVATMRLNAPQTGTLSGNARTITAFHDGGADSSQPSPNQSGQTELRLTFTVTDATQYTNLRLYNGASAGNGDVWLDNVALVEGTYTGSYDNVGKVAAATVTITRTIDGTTETIIDQQSVAGDVTYVDTTPAINGTNTYKAITYSGDGAASAPVEFDMVTTESQWAFLSTGDGYASAVKFYGDLALGSNPARDSALVVAAGRSTPISLFGTATALDVNVSATVVVGDGSTPEDIEAFLLTAGLSCFRDPSGRRVFGVVSGSLANRTPYSADLTLKISEAQ